jgi:HEPN domain-containing protein
MKTHEDLARGLWLKGKSDLANAQMCLDAGLALDTACFHAQQAAEKCLKAHLTLNRMDFPYMHNLAALVEMCKSRDDSFEAIMKPAQLLTPYAVEARYDDDFWPDQETTREAVLQAKVMLDFILMRLPEPFRSSLTQTVSRV